MHIVTGARKKLTSHDLIRKDTCWPDLSVRRELQQLSILHKVIHKKIPLYLLNDLTNMSDENARQARKFKEPDNRINGRVAPAVKNMKRMVSQKTLVIQKCHYIRIS